MSVKESVKIRLLFSFSGAHDKQRNQERHECDDTSAAQRQREIYQDVQLWKEKYFTINIMIYISKFYLIRNDIQLFISDDHARITSINYAL